MNVVLTIDDMEAIPVRALAYVGNWRIAPDDIVEACSKPPTKEIVSYSIPDREALPTYLVTVSAYRPMSSMEWEPFIVELECLGKRLNADERVDGENWSLWREQATKKLPDGAFVKRDDFQRWFSATRPLKDTATPSNDEELDDYYEQESDALNLDPYIPTELREAVFSGFERYRNNDDVSNGEDAAEIAHTEGGADDNQEPTGIERCAEIAEFHAKLKRSSKKPTQETAEHFGISTRRVRECSEKKARKPHSSMAATVAQLKKARE